MPSMQQPARCAIHLCAQGISLVRTGRCAILKLSPPVSRHARLKSARVGSRSFAMPEATGGTPRRAKWARRLRLPASRRRPTPLGCALGSVCGGGRLRCFRPDGLGARGCRLQGGGDPARLRARPCERLRAAASGRGRWARRSRLPTPGRRAPRWAARWANHAAACGCAAPGQMGSALVGQMGAAFLAADF